MNPKREKLKRWFLDEPERMVARDGDLYKCEGQLFRTHRCNFGLHLNEVIYTRWHIQSLSNKEQEYFWDKINCALMCGYSHTKFGHSRKFREWWVWDRLLLLGYTPERIAEYINNAPLVIK